MHRLIEFIKRIYVVLLFVLLEGIALMQYAQSSPYTEAKILSRTTAVGGAVSGAVTDVGHFFTLPAENRKLTARIAELEQTLERERALSAPEVESEEVAAYFDDGDLNYRYYPARVISLTTNRERNYIVVDRGEKEGIKRNMGVITPNRELVGYVVSVAEHYSAIMPILNTKFNIGGRLTDNGYACSVRWSGASPHYAEAIDISTYAEPKAGMAIEVSSERLPSGVLIGYIEEAEHNAAQTAYTAKLRLATNLSTLDNVLIVENAHYGEIEALVEELE